MENKLISMVDFVLDQNSKWSSDGALRNIVKYATFLKQPLKLGFFVPCDGNGNVLEEPNSDKVPNMPPDLQYDYWNEWNRDYQKAKDRVLFEGFEVIGQSEGFCEIELKNGDFWMTFVEGEIKVTNQFNQEYSVHVIEDLIQEDSTLTASAIKQFEL